MLKKTSLSFTVLAFRYLPRPFLLNKPKAIHLFRISYRIILLYADSVLLPKI